MEDLTVIRALEAGTACLPGFGEEGAGAHVNALLLRARVDTWF